MGSILPVSNIAADEVGPAPGHDAPLPTDAASTDVILRCMNIWKVFAGPGNKAVGDVLASNLSTQEKRGELEARNAFCAIEDVSLEIRRGEILMVMGLSGSGKSTLLRCMSRLVEPTRGDIWLNGIEMLKATDQELIRIRREQIGMVFQNFGLLPHLTAIDNVTFPLRVQGMPKAARMQRGQELLELVGLGERSGHYPSQLSGGQQQRVGIARSLAGDPALWFLDEPFSALDPLIRRQMQDEFLRLQSQLDKSIVFVTHDFAEAARLGDRIVIMRDGRIVQVGTAAEIIFRPADDYVRRFIADVPVLQTLKLKHLLAQVVDCGFDRSTAPVLDQDLCLDRALPIFMKGAPGIVVRGANGNINGVISRDRFVDFLSAGQ